MATAADRSIAESGTDTAADSVRAVISDQAWGPSLADECNCCPQRCGWFAGADYRLVRTHFSEAVAFATLTTNITPGGPDLRVAASELNFNFQSAFAVYAGYHLKDFADHISETNGRKIFMDFARDEESHLKALVAEYNNLVGREGLEKEF